ncbi:hypothetical protein RKD20_006223 [Streptomyces sp. SLBN-8D4]
MPHTTAFARNQWFPAGVANETLSPVITSNGLRRRTHHR